ncbi:MAG: uracil-DNA glycosylase [Rhodospirillales bacterium]
MLPQAGCGLCPRLADLRAVNRASLPDGHNDVVAPFGDTAARLLIVGLAPGRQGANRTGRPFTGDYAGDLLYPRLIAAGFARGNYDRRPDDGLQLIETRITNAVRCVPPENKPTTQEIATCNGFLTEEIAGLPRLRAILALGLVAHKAVLRALGLKQNHAAFTHGALHRLPQRDLLLADSYHCSRYNTNTGRLTTEMFDQVLRQLGEVLETD